MTDSNATIKTSAAFHILGTTIGNYNDFPARSLELVKSCEILVVEEDRPARQLLKAAGIHRDYYKFTEHSEADTIDAVRKALKKNKTVAYASDQGMPNLSDPGWQLTNAALELGAKIHVVPGPSSVSAALSACPFPIDQFYFAGFLPRQDGARLAAIESFQKFSCPIVIMETPYRRDSLLSALENALPQNHNAMFCFDISSEDEAYLWGNLAKIKKLAASLPPKRPFVLVLGPK